MKILFISSGNSATGIKPIVFNQGESLKKSPEIELNYYPISGKGVFGYIRNIIRLKKEFKKADYDIVHAHYSLSGFVASLAGAKPLVVSLMGSDVKASRTYRIIIRVFAYVFRWKGIIVKSKDMDKSIAIKNSHVIPNGVNLGHFYPLDKNECQKKLNWDPSKKHILFPADSSRPEKNFQLAKHAIESISNSDIELHTLNNVPNTEMPLWYNASEIILLTSLWEGSPNAIKEAMACNCPIVATNVGDIKWILGNKPGGFISTLNHTDIIEKIEIALAFANEQGKTNGRQRIIELGIDSETIANRIIDIYHQINNR